MGRIVLGIIIGVILLPIALMAWLRFGHVPVAVNDPPFPYEAMVTAGPLNARIGRQMVKNPPIQVNEDNLVAGAHTYSEQCATCHGFHGKPSKVGVHMFPAAPPLWEKHHTGDVIGVSDDPPGETYWKVSNGIRLTGMPAFKDVLTDTQMWQVSLLLANADKPLPYSAVMLVRGEPLPNPAALPPLPEVKK